MIPFIGDFSMKIQKFACVLFSCLFLCSCPFDEETELVAVPSSSSVEPAEPSILDCPIEDLEKEGKYPLPEFDPPHEPDDVGWCTPSALELSAEELSFNAQGGVRCVTSMSLWILGESSSKNGWKSDYCYIEKIVRFIDERTFIQTPKADSVFVRVSDGSTFAGTRREFDDFFRDWNWKFYKMVCPWLTVTNVDIWTEGRGTLLVSVKKNETGNERDTSVGISMGDCGGGFKITQSPK